MKLKTFKVLIVRLQRTLNFVAAPSCLFSVQVFDSAHARLFCKGDSYVVVPFRIAVGGRVISLGFISSYHAPGGVDRSAKHATIIQKVCQFLLIV